MIKSKSKSFIKILRSKRGESIMELLVAMMVFTISLTALTLIIRFSLNFTMIQIQESLEAQRTVNIMTAGFDGANQIGAEGFTFGIEIFDSTGITLKIQASHPVKRAESILHEDRVGETGIIAFYPNP